MCLKKWAKRKDLSCSLKKQKSQKNVIFNNNNNLLFNKNFLSIIKTSSNNLRQSNFNRSFHQRVRSINRIGPHNCDVISVIIGLMLGDGYCNVRTGEGTRICLRQGEIHKEYLFHLYEFFLVRGYCSKLEPRRYSRKLKHNDITKIYYGYEFNTYTFRSLNWIHKLFYKNGKKIVPLNIEYLITPLTLAVWISDDGGWANGGVRIATNEFTLAEVSLLANILKSKFALDVTIQKISIENKYSIYIKKNSLFKLKEIIFPYLNSSMYYKLGIKATNEFK